MAKKLPELDSGAGLGSIDSILNNQSVSDLSWLDVDPEEYRALEALPKQNLDIIPELSRALTHEGQDSRVPARIPLRQNTIVNTNPLERVSPPSRSSIASIGSRVATYVMAGLDSKTLEQRLRLEFSSEDLARAASSIREVFLERGLLGNVYVNSSHFPRCAQEGTHRKFVAKHCKRSLFVLSKPECTGCVHNKQGRCASFKKRIVDTVPYDEKTFNHYLPTLVRERRASVPTKVKLDDSVRREKLRLAFLKSPIIKTEAVQKIQQRDLPAKVNLTEADVRDFWARRAAASEVEPLPSPIFLLAAKRIMTGGANAKSLLASSDSHVRTLAFEHGILGHTYLDADALGGPREALDLIKSKGLSPDFVLLRSASSDIRSSDALNELSKVTSVVSKRPEINKETFISACERAVRQGRMASEQLNSVLKNVKDNSNWMRLTSQVNLYTPVEAPRVSSAQGASQGSFHYGDTSTPSVSFVDGEEVRRFISHLMNTGLSGKNLQTKILARYSREDLRKVPEIGRSLAAEDGVQGFYFVDPSAYKDYGKGCIEGSKLFRKQSSDKNTKYILAGASCTGCMHQTAPSWCNKYAKKIARNIPDSVRREAADRRKLPVIMDRAPIHNPVSEFELQSELPIDLNGSRASGLDISITSPKISS